MKRLLYIILLAFLLTACGKAETNNKKEQVETKQTGESSDNQVDNTESSEAKDEDSQSTADAPNDNEVQEPSNQAESNTNQSNKNESTGNSNTTTGSNNDTTTKPSTGNNNTTTKPSTGSGNNNSGPTGNSGSTGSTGSTGNTQNNNGGTTKPSTPVHEHKWTEVVEEEIHYYAWRTICGKCGEDLTDMTEDDRLIHVTLICRSRYGTVYKEVDFVTENIQKEIIVTGYKCECGAEKK